MISEFPLPTPKDCTFFAEEGYWVSPIILSQNEIEAALESQERFYQGAYDSSPAFKWPRPRVSTSSMRKHPYASFYQTSLAAIAQHPLLGEIASLLTGESEIRLWQDQLLYAEPDQHKSHHYAWHTERSRWKNCSSENMITAWIPFQDCSVEMEPITLLPKSHHEHFLDLPNDWDPGDRPRQVMTIQRGQVSFQHCRLVHGNGQNKSSEIRRGMAVHLAPSENQFREQGNFSHINERLMRKKSDGAPDYTDERVSPVLYTRTTC